MFVDIKRLKSQLTLEDYENILTELGLPVVSKTSALWLLPTGCHHKNPQDGGNNLKFYTDTKTFKCFSRDCRVNDIIALTQTRKSLFESNFSFIDAVNFIIDNSSVEISDLLRSTTKPKDVWDWEKFLGRYIRNASSYSDNYVYDSQILKFFPKIYHTSFLEDNISIETMEKFGLCFYPRNQQIVIPIYNEHMELVGLQSRNLIPEKINRGLKYQPTKLLNGDEYKFPTSTVLYGLGQNRENIIKTKTARLFEGAKSVLQMEDILDCNNTVAMFGMNMSKYKRQLLLDLGIENIEICLDKQYYKFYNENNTDKENEEYFVWEKKVEKIINLFQGYVNIDIVYDEFDLLNFKDSPSDRGKEVWQKLWEQKDRI